MQPLEYKIAKEGSTPNLEWEDCELDSNLEEYDNTEEYEPFDDEDNY